MNIFFGFIAKYLGLFLLFFILLPVKVKAQSNQIYVKFNYSGTETGSSSQPYNTLSEAVNRAASLGATNSIIYIQGGDYLVSPSDISISNFTAISSCSALNNSNLLTIRPAANASSIRISPSGNISDFWNIENVRCLNIDGQGKITIDAQKRNSSQLVYLHGSTLNNVIFQNFSILNSNYNGIKVTSPNVTNPSYVVIRGNYVDNTWNRSINVSGNTIYVENNEVSNGAMMNSTSPHPSGGWPANLATTSASDGSSSRNIYIRNNKVHNSWGEGIGVFSLEGGEISGNEVYDVWSVSIYVDGAHGTSSNPLIINGNYIHNSDSHYYRDGNPASGISLSCENSKPYIIDNIQITNNLFVNSKRGLRYWNAGAGNCNNIADISFVNNTVYNPSEYSIMASDPPSLASNINVRNNILDGAASGSFSGWSFSHNNWIDGIPSGLGGSGSRSGSPGFVVANPSNNSSPTSFSLSSSSLNINAGTSQNAPSRDFFGTSRPQGGNFDVGFHEYSGPYFPSITVAPTDMPSNTVTPRPSTSSPTPTRIMGDADADGDVDISDYNIWFEYFLNLSLPITFVSDPDFNNDGKVDGVDFVILINRYTG